MNGTQVRTARKARGLTQVQLARELGVSQGYVSLVESNRRSVPRRLAKKLAAVLRQLRVKNFWPYLVGPGGASWYALFTSGLHPALALVFIVPLLPGGARDEGLFVDTDGPSSPLHDFEHQLKRFVDFGLFWFAFTQAVVVLGAGLPLGVAAGVSGTRSAVPPSHGVSSRASRCRRA